MFRVQEQLLKRTSLSTGKICKALAHQSTQGMLHHGTDSRFFLPLGRVDPQLICDSPHGFVQLVLCLCVPQLRLQQQCLSFRFLRYRRFGLRPQVGTVFQPLR